MSGGVLRVSGRCLESVCRLSVKCLDGCLVSDWKVFGGCMKRVSGKIYLFNHFLGVQINPIVAMESRCILPLPK